MNVYRLRVSLASMLLAALGACGSGPQTSGIEGSGFEGYGITSAGLVTELGSIFVNGVEYDLTGATITIDGAPAAENDLDVGNIVIVEADSYSGGATASATRVTAGIAVAGPISAIDVAQNRLTVLGQLVEIDTGTVIEGRIEGEVMGGLSIGNDIEVSGFADSTGLLLARRIAPRRPGTSLQVSGYVTNLDADAKAFAINGQPIDYASAALAGFGSRSLDGAAVRVTANSYAPNATLVADTVSYRDLHLPGEAGDLAQLQGWVTRYASASDFDVDGHPVVATAATRVVGPVTEILGIVRLDAFVQVTGKLLENGVVSATEIATNNAIGLDAVISAIEPDYLYGDFPASRCRLTAATAISIDGVAATLDALAVGDVATVHMHNSGPHIYDYDNAICQMIAVEHNVRGALESKPEGTLDFSVMGQRIWLDHDLETLGALDVGDLVEVSGITTAEGDILASAIHAAPADRGYRVIGLARNVDPLLEQFELGQLVVFYGDAELGGFADETPAEGARVLVMADFAPSAGVLRASIVRYAGGVPRGALANIVTLNGLITRFASPDDFDVEGRHFLRADKVPQPTRNCDPDKFQVDMRLSVSAVGNLPGLAPIYWALGCPEGRRLDPLVGYGYPPATLEIWGPVQTVDLAHRALRVGGVDVMLHPASSLTRVTEYLDCCTANSEPASLGQIVPGERAWVEITGGAVSGGARPVDALWLGDTDTPDIEPMHEVTIHAPWVSVADPELTLATGIRVRIESTTQLILVDCYSGRDVDYAEFRTVLDSQENSYHGRVELNGLLVGNEFLPTTIALETTDWCFD